MYGDRGTLAAGLAVTALCLTTGVACGGDTDGSLAGPASLASCALAVEYNGHRYIGNAAAVRPVEGKPLGTATQPGCQDTPDGPEAEGSDVEVVEIEGVLPDVAIALTGRGESILIREDVDYERLPPELARLLSAPSCDSGDQSVELSGRWLGILGADGQTELDLDPPYDVRILVAEASLADYARAELTVRVPATLGRPLTRKDVESSLWEGGTLTATVSCRDGDFVAAAIKAAPPE
jgi:hypothetical protein